MLQKRNGVNVGTIDQYLVGIHQVLESEVEPKVAIAQLETKVAIAQLET